MTLRHVDCLLSQHHAKEADEGDHRRRRRTDLDEAIRGPYRQPHEERHEIPKHRQTPYSCGRSTTRPAEPDPTLR
jgi:hypothetical protein